MGPRRSARRWLSSASRAFRALRIWLEPGIGLPLERGRLPIVRVTGPGSMTLPFIIDTAAGGSVLHAGLVERLGLEKSLSPPGGVVLRDSEKRALPAAGIARLRGVSLGAGASLEVEAAFLDLTGPLATLGRPDLAGILGQDLLRRFAVLFHARRGVVRLLDSRRLPSDLGRILGPRDWEEHELEFDANGHPTVCIPVAGRGAYRMLIDTGCTHAGISGRLARDLGLSPRGTSETVGLHGVLRTSDAYELSGLDFGPWRVDLRDVPVYEEEVGIIGYAVLRRIPFVLDGPRSRLLTPISPPRSSRNRREPRSAPRVRCESLSP